MVQFKATKILLSLKTCENSTNMGQFFFLYSFFFSTGLASRHLVATIHCNFYRYSKFLNKWIVNSWQYGYMATKGLAKRLILLASVFQKVRQWIIAKTMVQDNCGLVIFSKNRYKNDSILQIYRRVHKIKRKKSTGKPCRSLSSYRLCATVL